jgi:inosose dehydratase
MKVDRRTFVGAAAAAAAGASVGRPGGAAEGPLYPPVDLAMFDTPITPKPFALRLGYAAITWDPEDEQAIRDIAAVGYRGIQLRSGVLAKYGGRAADLKKQLDDHGLALLCFSSGSSPAYSPGREKEIVDKHVSNARFARALGGSVLQIISSRPKDREPAPAEFEWLAGVLNAIGRQTLDLGVRVAYHNHINAYGEAPDEVARVLDLTDPRYVDFLLDIAHYAQGGGDPVAAVRRHGSRLTMLHLKDVTGAVPPPGKAARQGYTFVELGQGRVDVKGVVDALRAIKYRGPAVIELDKVPVPGRTPKESAEMNRRYVVETLGLAL